MNWIEAQRELKNGKTVTLPEWEGGWRDMNGVLVETGTKGELEEQVTKHRMDMYKDRTDFKAI